MTYKAPIIYAVPLSHIYMLYKPDTINNDVIIDSGKLAIKLTIQVQITLPNSTPRALIFIYIDQPYLWSNHTQRHRYIFESNFSFEEERVVYEEEYPNMPI